MEVRDTADQVLAQAQQLINKGFSRSATQLTEAVKQFFGDAAFCDLRGVVYAQQHQYDIAEADFRKVLKLNPSLVGAYLNLGHLYQQEFAKILRPGRGSWAFIGSF